MDEAYIYFVVDLVAEPDIGRSSWILVAPTRMSRCTRPRGGREDRSNAAASHMRMAFSGNP
jgi:hypothetical protein